MDTSTVISLVAVAVVAVFTSITAPLILARRTERQHRHDQLADYQRQDEVARLAAATAARMLRQQQEMAEAAAEQAETAGVKLDAIHTLVNSDMTAARQSELDQTRVLLAVLRRVVHLSRARGQDPEAADLEALDSAEARAAELERMLADRLHQLRQVEDTARASGRAGQP